MILFKKEKTDGVCQFVFIIHARGLPTIVTAQLPYNFTPNRGIWVDAGPCTSVVKINYTEIKEVTITL